MVCGGGGHDKEGKRGVGGKSGRGLSKEDSRVSWEGGPLGRGHRWGSESYPSCSGLSAGWRGAVHPCSWAGQPAAGATASCRVVTINTGCLSLSPSLPTGVISQ